MSKEEIAKAKIEELKQLFTNQKVKLGVIQDFKKSFDKANDGGLKIGETLIDALSKAEQKYKQNISDFEKALKIGEKLTSSYKELGVDVPKIVSNQILSCKSEIKENQKLISSISGFYSKF